MSLEIDARKLPFIERPYDVNNERAIDETIVYEYICAQYKTIDDEQMEKIAKVVLKGLYDDPGDDIMYMMDKLSDTDICGTNARNNLIRDAVDQYIKESKIK